MPRVTWQTVPMYHVSPTGFSSREMDALNDLFSERVTPDVLNETNEEETQVKIFNYDGVDYQYSFNYDYCLVDRVIIPNTVLWYMHPEFITSAEEAGYEMKLFSDLLAFYKKNRVEFEECRYWGSYVREELSRIFYINDAELRRNDRPLFKVRPSSNRSSESFFDWPTISPEPIKKLYRHRSDSEGFYEWTTEYWSDHPTSAVIHSWDYRPELLFLSGPRESQKRKTLYFGLELEVNTKLSPTDIMNIVTETEPKQEPFFYFKSDSSIEGMYNWAYEIVTHPSTPKRMRLDFKLFFKKLEAKLATKALSINDVFDNRPHLGNGLHIHLSKEAFGIPSKYSTVHVNKFVAAYNQWDTTNQEWLHKISCRPIPLKDSRYYRIHPGLDGRTVARRVGVGVEPQYQERRVSCHLADQTAEVRIFQGTVNLKHILKCIDFTEAMFYYTGQMPLSALGSSFPKHFTTWLNQQPQYHYAKGAV